MVRAMIRWLRWIGLAIVFFWFFGGGITHFTNEAFFVSIVPPYVPFPRAAVYISGVLEVLFALALVPPSTRQWAGYLLIALTLAVTPANVHMWLHPELFPDTSETMLAVRLVIQVLLLALIAWSTRPARAVG